jgi:hypothetical protein
MKRQERRSESATVPDIGPITTIERTSHMRVQIVPKALVFPSQWGQLRWTREGFFEESLGSTVVPGHTIF